MLHKLLISVLIAELDGEFGNGYADSYPKSSFSQHMLMK